MKSQFPNTSQFSPTQTPLVDLLLLVKEHQPDRQKIKEEIGKRFFSTTKDSKIPENTIYALSEYQLIDKPKDDIKRASLTTFGEVLAAKAQQGESKDLYEEFARHIILNLHGMDLIQAVSDLAARGTNLTKETITKELRYRGFHLPNNGTHLNGMRQWFEKAGLVESKKWVVDNSVLQKILGNASPDDLEIYEQLTTEQKAFAMAFARLNQEEALSNKVAEYASALFGVEFPQGGLPQSTLFALQDAGLLTCKKTTTGQGSKPYIVYPTEKLKNEFIEPILLSMESSAGPQYRKLIRMPFAEILAGLKLDDKNKKGLALEALAFYLGRLINLDFVKWRLRSKDTGGAELDVIMEGTNMMFSRWQMQCKNSKQATLEDIAKELGLAQIIRTNVIMIVTTGTIGKKALEFAERIMRDTNHQVILINKTHLQKIKDDPTSFVQILKSQSEAAMTLKRNQVGLV
jgi:hypothetical protein